MSKKKNTQRSSQSWELTSRLKKQIFCISTLNGIWKTDCILGTRTWMSRWVNQWSRISAVHSKWSKRKRKGDGIFRNQNVDLLMREGAKLASYNFHKTQELQSYYPRSDHDQLWWIWILVSQPTVREFYGQFFHSQKSILLLWVKVTDSLKSKRSTAFIELTNKSIRFGNPLETGLWQKCNYLNPAFMTHF